MPRQRETSSVARSSLSAPSAVAAASCSLIPTSDQSLDSDRPARACRVPSRWMRECVGLGLHLRARDIDHEKLKFAFRYVWARGPQPSRDLIQDLRGNSVLIPSRHNVPRGEGVVSHARGHTINIGSSICCRKWLPLCALADTVRYRTHETAPGRIPLGSGALGQGLSMRRAVSWGSRSSSCGLSPRQSVGNFHMRRSSFAETTSRHVAPAVPRCSPATSCTHQVMPLGSRKIFASRDVGAVSLGFASPVDACPRASTSGPGCASNGKCSRSEDDIARNPRRLVGEGRNHGSAASFCGCAHSEDSPRHRSAACAAAHFIKPSSGHPDSR